MNPIMFQSLRILWPPSVAGGKCANRSHMRMLSGLVKKETQELVGDMVGHE